MPIYKGETPIKSVTRVLVWQQHRHLLKPAAFKVTPHVFLASRVAGDVATLRNMGVVDPNIWAVEKDREESQQLLERRRKEGFRLFRQKIEGVLVGHPGEHMRSVYLDYCGNLEGTANTTRKVVSRLSVGSALSVTLFLGRELERPEDREGILLRRIRDHTDHQVTVVQSILYMSVPEGGALGSPMGTWTFYLGPSASRSKMRFDLRSYTANDAKRLTPEAALELWQTQRELADVRRKAAIKANVTRAAG